MPKWLWFFWGFGVALILMGVVLLKPLEHLSANQNTPQITPSPTARPTLVVPPSATPAPTPLPAEPSLTWRREGGIAGFCDVLTIDDKIELHYGRCGTGLRFAELTAEELRAYWVYVARYASFEFARQDNPGGPDNMTVRLSFVGRGTRVPTPEEQAEVARWVSGIYARLLTEEQRAELVAQARLDLARRLGISPDAIRTVAVEATTWPDACLGIVEEGVFCAQVLTPGYRIILEANGARYEYRTNQQDLVRAVKQAQGSPTAPAAQPTVQPTPTELPTAAPTPTAWPTPLPTWTPWPVTITDWRGEYYGNPELQGAPVLVRNDREVHFNWGYGAPAAPVPADYFSARWARRVHFEEGIYTFRLEADDGVRLWVAGNLVIDRWRGGYGVDTVRQQIWTGDHDVVVEYFELAGTALVRLSWQREQEPPKPTPVITAWRAEYYNNPELAGAPRVVRNEDEIAFDWREGSPDRKVNRDYFAARFTRTVELPAGSYRFYVVVDDGARVYVDDRLILDAWTEGIRRQLTRDVELAAGSHTFRVEYFEQTGGAALFFRWERLNPNTLSRKLPLGRGAVFAGWLD